ncbi:VOC family protein, partial [Acinetobacter baumannii]|nr:VOC family protein [Acinetobacter baumannii]
FKLDESLPIEYYRIETPSIMGGLLKRPAQTPPMEYGPPAFPFSVPLAPFDAVAAPLFAPGGIVAIDKFSIPGRAWHGYFVDLDHNVFGIFQVDENAA